MRFRLEQLDSVDSTSSELLRRANTIDIAGAALLAGAQTAGRGRTGRPWQSPPGNLHLSAAVAIPHLRTPGHYALLAAIALRDALHPFAPAAPLHLKWPNDLLANNRKLAGILAEAIATPAGPRLVLGIGANLAHAPTLDRPTTALAAFAPPPTPAAAAHAILASLDRWLTRYETEGFPPIRAAWLAAAHRPGDPLAVTTPAGPRSGTFAGLANSGALLLQTPGSLLEILAGDLTPPPPPPQSPPEPHHTPQTTPNAAPHPPGTTPASPPPPASAPPSSSH